MRSYIFRIWLSNYFDLTLTKYFKGYPVRYDYYSKDKIFHFYRVLIENHAQFTILFFTNFKFDKLMALVLGLDILSLRNIIT